ncbi:Hexaprenyldihydroxybenzoate methyltransferase, mitochondrial-like protein [Gossypium australe]|uniref:Hexaprenyldihydroxybenzoate methyltransferase, mitochondrial-like protein n=1 Tax=Gossypium australe TaxID=47621 RepID=A0A5B6WSH4_9ROSI|nr:Hexaprenyldihydroxybenzoate methyltransferase, mitochondrial-like protein [Gossypium australe]
MKWTTHLVIICDVLYHESYSWWSTLIAIVPKENGNKSVAECEREFVHLSKYAHEIVPNEEEMCIKFKDGLNDKINRMTRGTEIVQFVVLFDRAQKMEEVYNNKKQRERKARDFGK